MKIIEISSIALISAFVALILKEKFPEISIAISLVASSIILIFAVDLATPIISKIKEISNFSNIEDNNLSIIFKALGICFFTQFSCDACLDAGQKSIANKLELFGKVAVLVVAFPLIVQILNIVTSLVGG